MHAKKFTKKTFSWGGIAAVARFPAHGSVSLSGSIRGGSLCAGSAELAKVHAAMLLEGTTEREKRDIQAALDSMGASLQFVATTDRLTFSARVRNKHLRDLLALIAEVLAKPSFNESELAILKLRERAALAMEAQDTRAQAGINFARLLFKKGHPNYQETTKESGEMLERITPATLRSFHKKILSRRTLVICAAGDVEPKNFLKLVQSYFTALPHLRVPLPRIVRASLHKPRSVRVYIPHKASVDYMTGLVSGISSAHKDFPALMLGLQVLGNPSGFTGRLMNIIREKEGLTYGVYSYMSGFAAHWDGYLMIWGTFAPQLLERGQASIRREIERIVAEGVTGGEARKHAEQYTYRAQVHLSNSAMLSKAAHQVLAEGSTLSYLDTFPKQVHRLTAKDVNKALNKYLLPAFLSEALAGPVEKKPAKA